MTTKSIRCWLNFCLLIAIGTVTVVAITTRAPIIVIAQTFQTLEAQKVRKDAEAYYIQGTSQFEKGDYEDFQKATDLYKKLGDDKNYQLCLKQIKELQIQMFDYK